MKRSIVRYAAWICAILLCVSALYAAPASAHGPDAPQLTQECDHSWIDGHVDIPSGCILYTCLFCGAEKYDPFAAPGMTDYDVSGDLAQALSTRERVVAKRNTVVYPVDTFAVQPSVKAPYAAGKLSDSQLQNGINYLNYIRYVARLPEVTLSDELNDSAQHGAVLLAATGKLSHRPSKPKDMTDAFYKKAYAGTDSSNIAVYGGYYSRDYLQRSLLGYMADSSGKDNLSAVGHRRQLLNPTLDEVGFGYAKSSSGTDYMTTWVDDYDAEPVDYKFISWPASGYVPTELLEMGTPWSVSLNPDLYRTPSVNDVKITLTRVSDGKSWKIDKTIGSDPAAFTPYLTVNTDWYGGASNCIIFLPNEQEIGGWRGVFTVEVTGLRTKSGEEASIKYWVDFFGVRDCQKHTYTEIPIQPTCDRQGYIWYVCEYCGFNVSDSFTPATGHSFDLWTIDTEPAGGTGTGNMHRNCANGHTEYSTYEFPLTDVPGGKYFSKPVYWAYVNGITKGKTATQFQLDVDCTRKQIVMFLWRAAGEPEPENMENPFTDVKADQFQKAILWAVEKGVTKGTSATEFSPEKACTRKQIVTFLYRYFGSPELTQEQQVNPFTDVKQDQFESAILWAYHNGITTGKTAVTFEPEAVCTRGQIVTFLYRAIAEAQAKTDT